MLFRNRSHAGGLLAERVQELRSESPVILGLPRGGVVVAEPVAKALGSQLDVIIVRKLGVPFQPELAMGAIGEGGVRVVEDSVLSATGLGAREVAAVERREQMTLDERIAQYRRWRTPVPLEGRSTVIVDDGIATGATIRAACQVVSHRAALRITVAVPVATPEAVERIRAVCDRVICLHTPARFGAIGLFYANFAPVAESEVSRILIEAAANDAA